MGEELSIRVNIGDRFYPLKIDAAEEETVRKAAKLINETSDYYRQNFPVKDKQDALALAALQFVTELLNVQGASEEEQAFIKSRITQFNELLEDVLK